MLKQIFLPHISPINHFSRLFLTYSQVDLSLFCKGFRHKAWVWLISWVRVSLRKSIRRIQPLTFGFQTTVKNKDIFSQDTVINTAPSCFGILEEMNLQVWFYESSSFSQLFACCYVLSGMNACVNQREQYSCQCFRYNSQNSRFLILPLSEKSHKTKPAEASLSPVQSAAETFPHFLLFSFCHPLPRGQLGPKPIALEKPEHNTWVEGHSLIWPSPFLLGNLTLKEKPPKYLKSSEMQQTSQKRSKLLK